MVFARLLQLSVDKTGFLRLGHKCIGNATEVIRTSKDCTMYDHLLRLLLE